MTCHHLFLLLTFFLITLIIISPSHQESKSTITFDFISSNYHKQLKREYPNFIYLNNDRLFLLYDKKNNYGWNVTMVTACKLNEIKNNSFKIGLSFASPSTNLIDVWTFENDTSFSDGFIQTNLDVTSLSTAEIFTSYRLDYNDTPLENPQVTKYEEFKTDTELFKIIQFWRAYNFTDGMDTPLVTQNQKNSRGVKFINYFVYSEIPTSEVNDLKQMIDDGAVLNQNQTSVIVIHSSGKGWFEYGTIYFFPINSTLQALRFTHGALMILSFTVLLVLSILSVRYLKPFKELTKIYLYIHITFVLLAILFVVIAFILSTLACHFETKRHYDSIHKIIGIIVFIAMLCYQLPISGPLFYFVKWFLSERKKHSHSILSSTTPSNGGVGGNNNNNGEVGNKNNNNNNTTNNKWNISDETIKEYIQKLHVWGGRLIILAGILNLYFGIHAVYARPEYFIILSFYLFIILFFIGVIESLGIKTIVNPIRRQIKKQLGITGNSKKK
ncbi:hypothetical protein ABK040_001499 [Willaertia magna]